MIDIKTLSNGIRLVCEPMPHVKSVSVGAWIAAGSFYEEPRFHGISHFIEHMLFKGTKSRSAKQIAEEMDFAGGQLNAFTARDCTCFYTKTLPENLDTSLSLLSDMITNSLFAEKDLITERLVVKEEIDMYEDNPEELVHDLAGELCYPSHPFGQNILGTHKSVESFDREIIREYMDLRYTADNIVISVAGKFDSELLTELCEKYFGKNIKKSKKCDFVHDIPEFNVASLIRHKPVEQANAVIAFEGLAYPHKNTYAYLILCNILGGSMSSRLFQKIREDMGLAYSVYTYPNTYAHAGYTTIYAGCASENFDTVKNLILEETEKLYSNGITEEEFIRAKKQLKGNFVLANETAGSRMSSYGKQLLLYNKINSDDDVIGRIDSVNETEISQALKLFDISKASLCAVMPK